MKSWIWRKSCYLKLFEWASHLVVIWISSCILIQGHWVSQLSRHVALKIHHLRSRMLCYKLSPISFVDSEVIFFQLFWSVKSNFSFEIAPFTDTNPKWVKMTQIEHLLFTIVAMIVMSQGTLCVRHETFWGEKGRNFIMSPLFVLSLAFPSYLDKL